MAARVLFLCAFFCIGFCIGCGSSASAPADAGAKDGATIQPGYDSSVPPGVDASQEAGGDDAGGDTGTGGGCTPSDAGSGDGGAALSVVAGPGAGDAGQTIAIGSGATGLPFYGVGAVSGGGGSGRLLIDYPAPYRDQILDALFKPGYGASLNLLKIEIGGDVSSVDGSEPSHLHTSIDLDCSRGYEWWLMQQAKARNPAIKLYALAYGAPSFVGAGSFWSQGMVDYLLAWLTCAKSAGLTIDYLGGWNENGYDKSWFENLHSTLAAKGFATKVVGADDVNWTVADDMTSDTTFGGAVDVVGVHNPCSGTEPMHCPSSTNATALGKPLWATSSLPLDHFGDAASMAAAMNRGYLDGKLTAYFSWPLLSAVTPAVPSPSAGLVVAGQPWSGAFDIGKTLWVSAHTAQFAQPGWLYVDGSSGYLGDASLPEGSFVTLQSPAGSDYATVVETTNAIGPQTVAFSVAGASAGATAHVWATDLGSPDPASNFVHAADVTPSGGSFWVTLAPNFIYTVTTTTGQSKGAAPGPARASMGLPYADAFESYMPATEARNLVDQEGAFEVVACGGGRMGQCVRQEAPATPIRPHSIDSTPYAVVGGPDWADYAVSADVLLEQAGSVEILARYQGRDATQIGHIAGYALSAHDNGDWQILRCDTGGGRSTITSGSVSAFNTNTWHALSLQLLGTTLIATIDGAQVGTGTDSTYTSGQAGVAVGLSARSWVNAQFDNLSITPLGQTTLTYTARVVNRSTGLALDVSGQSAADGAQVQVGANDEGSTSQEWQLAGDGSGSVQLLNVHSAKALAANSGGDAGLQLVQLTPAGSTAQRWQLRPTGDGFFRLFDADGLVADVASAATSNAVTVSPMDCGSTTQEWSLVVVPVAHGVYKLVNQATGLLLDVAGGSTSKGATTVLWTDSGHASQRWRLEPLGGGDYLLVNTNSNMAFDVPSATTTAGTRLEQWDINSGDSQHWGVRSVGGGAYALLTPHGNAADIQGYSPDAGYGPNGDAVPAGTPVVENPVAAGAASQAWFLVPAP